MHLTLCLGFKLFYYFIRGIIGGRDECKTVLRYYGILKIKLAFYVELWNFPN
jgi:hypothetical protein